MGKDKIALVGGDKRIAYMALILQEKGCCVISYGLADIKETKQYQKVEQDKTAKQDKKVEQDKRAEQDKKVEQDKRVKQDKRAERDQIEEKNTGLKEDKILEKNQIEEAESLEQAIQDAQIIICGIPLFQGGYLAAEKKMPDITCEDLIQVLKEGQKLYAGVIPEDFVKKCKEKKIECYDFVKEEKFAIANTIATAEGVIAEAISSWNTNLHKSKCLVLGYGRCGKVLAEKLKGLSANVTVVSANEEELAWADSFGVKVLPLEKIDEEISDCEYLFNTIPAMILGKELLQKVKKDTLILDIASGKGGVDKEAAKELGITVKHCLGLPGKYASKTSAKLLTAFLLGENF